MVRIDRARWIWSDDDGRGTNLWRWFRAEFSASPLQDTAVLSISADTRYRVWVDGALVGDGASSGVPWRQLVDRYDLDDLDPSVRHCVAVLVNATGCYPATRGGLLAEVRAGDDVLVASDDRWRVLPAVAYSSRAPRAVSNRARPYAVLTDRRRIPSGWRLPCFDDAEWPQAVPVDVNDPESGHRQQPWTRLVHEPVPVSTQEFRPVRLERVEECLDLSGREDPSHLVTGLSQPGRTLHTAVIREPDRLIAEGGAVLRCSEADLDGVYDPCLTLDFGTVRCARLELEVSGPAGAVIDIGYAERLVDGWFTISVEGPFAERVVLEGGRHVLTSWHWQAFRYVRLRVGRCWDDLTIHRLQAKDATAALTDRGTFEGAADLAKIETICRSTLRLSSVEAIVDTPWREAARWLGDGAAVTTGGLRSCFADRAVTDAFYRRAAACQLPSGLLAGVSNSPDLNPGQAFADFSLWWLIGLWRHYLWTGDETLVREHYGHALRVVSAFELADDHLLAPSAYPVFIDWSPVCRYGRLAYLNALFAEALQVLGRCALLIGDRHVEEQSRSQRSRLVAGFADHFVHPRAGLVVDTADDLVGADRFSETANAAAIAFGLVDDEVSDRIIAALWHDSDGDGHRPVVVEAEPYGTALVLQALARRGEVATALRIIRRRWGARMARRGATTTFEEWSRNGSWRSGRYRGFLRSISHAWSAYPAEFLLKDLPGIEIIEPGCRRIRIRQRRSVEGFASSWPTPKGPVTVRHVDDHTRVIAPEDMIIDAPPSVTVRPRASTPRPSSLGIGVSGGRRDR